MADNTLVQRGLLPPELIARNGEFLRPLVGVKPASGHYLHFCAFELGRGPDGAWWVLGDRTQAPSGAGFALENRVATTRALSDIYADMHVQRLAGFFRGFRDAAQRQANRDRRQRRHPDARPAQRNLFRARLYRPLSRLHAARRRRPRCRQTARSWCAPSPACEPSACSGAAWMRPSSIRSNCAMTAAYRHARHGRGPAPRLHLDDQCAGHRPARNPRLAAFMPRICAQALLGRPLELPEIATWWCGQREAERQHVIANFDKHDDRARLRHRPCLRRPARHRAAVRCHSSRAEGPLLDRLSNGADYVGQEQVQLSTAPVYVDGKLAAAADHPARLCRPHRRLDHHARRFRPRRLHIRIPPPSPCSAAARRPTSGWCPPSRSSASRCCRRTAEKLVRNARQPAEPRRRQPDLAGPLCRALRGDGAHPARLQRAPRRGFSKIPTCRF
jgi:hypothetical protein